MEDRLRLRAYSKIFCTMLYWDPPAEDDKYDENFIFFLRVGETPPLMQCTGLKDKTNRLIYEGDILVFENGDKFYIDCEDWLELFVHWIGEPKCEDQARDFYRIENSEIIGNIHENPKLIE